MFGMLCPGAACGKKGAQLMLVMLEKGSPVDAHDAGRGCGWWEKGGPADAHDAECGRGL